MLWPVTSYCICLPRPAYQQDNTTQICITQDICLHQDEDLASPVVQHTQIELDCLLLYKAFHLPRAQVCYVIHGVSQHQQCPVNCALPKLLSSLHSHPNFMKYEPHYVSEQAHVPHLQDCA